MRSPRPLRLKPYSDYVGISEFIQKEKKMKLKVEKSKIKLFKLSRLGPARRRSKLSMAALGKKVRLSRNQVWFAEHGRPVVPEIAARFARVLRVSLVSLR